MHALMVTPNAFPLMGGIETHVHEVAPRLVRAGLEVTVLTCDRTGRLPALEEADGVRVRRVRAWPRGSDYFFAPDVMRIVAHGPWDLIHCQGYHTLVPPLAMLGALNARLPYVLTFHSGGNASVLRNWLRRPQRLALRPLLARSDRLIAVSPFEATMFQRELGLRPDQFVTIPNGATLPTPDPALLAEAGSEPLILSIGRLERYKGHQRVVAALPYVLERIPEARLRIAGAGPYEPELRRRVADLRLEESVEIAALDPRDRTSMADLLVRARLVVLLSDYEANPVAVMEALGLARPVLVTDTSGLRDLADRGLVRAIALDSPPPAIAAAILTEMLTPRRPPTLSLPTWDDCADALLGVYRAAVVKAA